MRETLELNNSLSLNSAGPTRRNRGPATSVRPTVQFLTGFHTSLSGTSPQSPSFPARFLSPLAFRHVSSVPSLSGAFSQSLRFPARLLSPLAFQHVSSVPSLSGTSPQFPRFPARLLSPLVFRHVFSGSSLSGNLPQSPRFPAPLFSPNWLEGRKDAVNRCL